MVESGFIFCLINFVYEHFMSWILAYQRVLVGESRFLLRYPLLKIRLNHNTSVRQNV